MLNHTDIRWRPFPTSVDWLAGVEPETGLAGLVIRLLLVARARSEMASAALGLLAQRDRELAAVRRQNARLVEELRALRRKQAA